MTQADPDLAFMSAKDVRDAICGGKVTALEVFEVISRRIELLETDLNSYCTLDLDRARDLARLADQQLARGDEVGPLHGVPVAIKEDLPVEGLSWTFGSRLRAGMVADRDGLVVARLRRAGAIILGKTNEPEFGHKGTTDNLLFGTTSNPWNLTRTVGGSSGGSGAAVAAGLAYLALGTDIAGSIRIPASCCGIVGHKPSFGRVPRIPAGNAYSPLVVGPLARTVSDAALALSVIAGPHEGDPFCLPSSVRTGERPGGQSDEYRIGWCTNPMGVPIDPAVSAVTGQALALLDGGTEIRVEIVEETLRAPLEALYVIFKSLSVAATGLGSVSRFEEARGELSPSFATFISDAFEIELREYLAAQAAVTQFAEQVMPEYWGRYDILAMPTISVAPFPKDFALGPESVSGTPIDPHTGWISTWPFNLSGNPAISVPCGWTDDGLPIGLQLVGRRHDDDTVLHVAAVLEQVQPWLTRRPPG